MESELKQTIDTILTLTTVEHPFGYVGYQEQSSETDFKPDVEPEVRFTLMLSLTIVERQEVSKYISEEMRKRGFTTTFVTHWISHRGNTKFLVEFHSSNSE